MMNDHLDNSVHKSSEFHLKMHYMDPPSSIEHSFDIKLFIATLQLLMKESDMRLHLGRS